MRAFGQWAAALFTTPAGVVILAALDSTTFFWLPLGVDAAIVIVAARHNDIAWLVPLLATAGSVAGAALTFWMGRKIGDAGLERHASSKRLARVRARIRSSGAIGLAVLDLIPPPFPFTLFVLAAGALDVTASTFFITLAACRFARFGLETLLAVLYGRSIITWLESDAAYGLAAAAIAAAVAAAAVTIVRLTRSDRFRSQRARA